MLLGYSRSVPHLPDILPDILVLYGLGFDADWLMVDITFPGKKTAALVTHEKS